MTHIRRTTTLDMESVRTVHLCAFPEEEKQLVANLAVDMLREATTPETISLVAGLEGLVVGHAAFSPVTIDGDNRWKGYILSPLGVMPEYQNRQIGSELIRNGIKILSERKADALFVYGDPQYYNRFGFKAEAASKYRPPYPIQHPFGWQAIVFKETGFVAPAAISCVASLCRPELW